jgi:hypothetical protein
VNPKQEDPAALYHHCDYVVSIRRAERYGGLGSDAAPMGNGPDAAAMPAIPEVVNSASEHYHTRLYYSLRKTGSSKMLVNDMTGKTHPWNDVADEMVNKLRREAK